LGFEHQAGTDVICETWALQAAVIPAKAGIHSANLQKSAVDGLDSRFRGNDRRFERDPIPNDTTTGKRTTRFAFSVCGFKPGLCVKRKVAQSLAARRLCIWCAT